MLVLTVISFQKMGLKTIKCILYIWFSLGSFSTPFVLQLFLEGVAMTDGAAGKGGMASEEANGDPHLFFYISLLQLWVVAANSIKTSVLSPSQLTAPYT